MLGELDPGEGRERKRGKGSVCCSPLELLHVISWRFGVRRINGEELLNKKPLINVCVISHCCDLSAELVYQPTCLGRRTTTPSYLAHHH